MYGLSNNNNSNTKKDKFEAESHYIAQSVWPQSHDHSVLVSQVLGLQVYAPTTNTKHY